jgi:hypothetical protein
MIFHNPDYIVNKTDKTPNIACNSIKKGYISKISSEKYQYYVGHEVQFFIDNNIVYLESEGFYCSFTKYTIKNGILFMYVYDDGSMEIRLNGIIWGNNSV